MEGCLCDCTVQVSNILTVVQNERQTSVCAGSRRLDHLRMCPLLQPMDSCSELTAHQSNLGALPTQQGTANYISTA